MKIHELFEDKQSLNNLVAKLEKVGGKIYAKITKGDESGWLGVNGSGKTKVYFAFYPDGTQQRFEKPVGEKDLKNGWKPEGGDYRDPETAVKDKTKADKIKRQLEVSRLREADIDLSDWNELIKICKREHIGLGISDKSGIADTYPDDEGLQEVDDIMVAYAVYKIILKDSEYVDDDDDEYATHDPIYVKFWRDPKNPEKIHATDNLDSNL